MGVAIEGWLKVLFDESPVAIAVSRRGVVLDGNAAYISLFGYENLDELRGQSLLVLVAPSHRQEIIEFLAQRARARGWTTPMSRAGSARMAPSFRSR
jgi:PAS domain S-box-containing protein